MTLLQIANDSFNIDSVDNLLKISYKIGIRLAIDLIAVFILVRYIYLPIYKHREFFFMFVIFNLIIFLISFLLNKIELSMGAAFGLFAVFSMLRYRTDNISIKDMTYLFLSIAIGLICAVSKVKGSKDMYEYIFLCGVNLVILGTTYVLESRIFTKKEMSKLIVYENIELVRSHKMDELLVDIRQRTGINAHRVAVQKINFLKDTAELKVYYYE
jgi:hypothetical protein